MLVMTIRVAVWTESSTAYDKDDYDSGGGGAEIILVLFLEDFGEGAICVLRLW